MTIEQMNFVSEYIEKLEQAINDYNDTEFLSEDNLFDTIRETINVFRDDFPQIEDSIIFHTGTAVSDANVVIGILRKNLIKNGYKEPNSKIITNMDKFWISFKTYFEREVPEIGLLKDCYIRYDNWNGGIYYLEIDYNYEYNRHYGIDYVELDDNVTISNIKMFIELAFSEWIKTESRYDFTISINDLFKKFKLSYKLQGGKIVKQGYKTTFINDKIINYAMLERKIAYAEDMILSNEMLDKKCALDYIIDSLQYIISIQPEKTINYKYSSAAKNICDDQSSKIYSVIKDEINELMKISNDFFDIRHNDYLNSQKQKREALSNSIFIEYLYNRAYSLLFILRLKNK